MTAQTEAGHLNLPNIERKQGGKQKGLNETYSELRGEKREKKENYRKKDRAGEVQRQVVQRKHNVTWR